MNIHMVIVIYLQIKFIIQIKQEHFQKATVVVDEMCLFHLGQCFSETFELQFYEMMIDRGLPKVSPSYPNYHK